MTSPRIRLVIGTHDAAAISRREPGTLVVAPGRGALARGGTEVRAPPEVARLVLALAARPGAIVANAELAALLFGDRADGGPDDAAKVVATYWHAARFVFPALGYAASAHYRGFTARPLDAATICVGDQGFAQNGSCDTCSAGGTSWRSLARSG